MIQITAPRKFKIVKQKCAVCINAIARRICQVCHKPLCARHCVTVGGMMYCKQHAPGYVE